ncbi:uncharacterized protein TrAFT101_006322 [Trichoderma asperellum]|uniref:uncharacterized protein n=1 Tax=Trichoderma asperellum TaxID=101201 RepID=UPI00332DC9F6|nr:hypothetical protein TrAFT101_006322 [Trichoderma asperellum]
MLEPAVNLCMLYLHTFKRSKMPVSPKMSLARSLKTAMPATPNKTTMHTEANDWWVARQQPMEAFIDGQIFGNFLQRAEVPPSVWLSCLFSPLHYRIAAE